MRRFITILAALVLLSACAAPLEQSTPLNLVGTWRENAKDSYQEAVITDDVIEIHWVTPDTRALYWAGTYQTPVNGEWISIADKEKTDRAIMASMDDSKVFKFVDGKIVYERSMLGVTQTVRLEKLK